VLQIAADDALAAFSVHDNRLRIDAIGPGAWGNQIAAKIDPDGPQAPP
jgi:hypothetical protein